MANESGVARSVASALEEVARWRAEAEERHKAELQEVDTEVESLQQAVANLQQQLEALGRFKEELVGRADRIDEDEIDRCYQAIFGALGEQGGALAGRATLVAEAEGARSLRSPKR